MSIQVGQQDEYYFTGRGEADNKEVDEADCVYGKHLGQDCDVGAESVLQHSVHDVHRRFGNNTLNSITFLPNLGSMGRAGLDRTRPRLGGT